MHSQRCPRETVQLAWMKTSCGTWGVRCCNVRRSIASVPNYGRSSACECSPGACTVSSSARPISGASSVVWGSRCKSPSAGPSNVTRKPCRPGSARHGPRSKNSQAPRAADRLHRRAGLERAPLAGVHPCAQGPDADHPVPIQLDLYFHCRWPVAHELPVPAARGFDAEGAACRVPQGAACSLEAADVDHLGQPEGPSQQARARVFGLNRGRCPDGIPTAVRARLESRGVPVGLAQAACPRQLFSGQPRRAQRHRPQQAQESPTPTLDHRRLLGPGWALVMSPFTENSIGTSQIKNRLALARCDEHHRPDAKVRSK